MNGPLPISERLAKQRTPGGLAALAARPDHPDDPQRMAEETGKGAWMIRFTFDTDGSEECEWFWDPDATAGDMESRHRRLLELLFGPRPGGV
ncbi:hypothetical protein ACFXA4_00215 [Streptomyces sp. NPDC059442]|uniref:hypothetical protein n=1 Tax=Streptomyces sp. NPDC059442 TaxID=3346830 RepID=UPI003677543A